MQEMHRKSMALAPEVGWKAAETSILQAVGWQNAPNDGLSLSRILGSVRAEEGNHMKIVAGSRATINIFDLCFSAGRPTRVNL